MTSDMRLVPDSVIANRLCDDCGFIWNEGGPRGDTDRFYRQSYQLRMHDTNAQNINFSASGAKPMALAVAEFLVERADLTPDGTLLEAGAGKGEFLARFLDLRPDWRATAFEPSSAFDHLSTRLPQVAAHRGGYQEVSIEDTFDVVASLAVIEHVEDPFGFLTWLRGRVAPEGRLLLTFPDFARNPNDLFCVDHLSKLSMPQLAMMATRAGFEIVSSVHVGIALLVLLRLAEPSDEWAGAAEEAASIAGRNEALAREMVAAVARAHHASVASDEKMAVFGLGMAGLVAPVLEGFDAAGIAAYVDENPTMHGQTIGGLPVVDLPCIAELGIRHIALSVSPIYRDQVTAKLAGFGVKIYV